MRKTCLFLVCVLIITLFSGCQSSRLACESDTDCGSSCTYGCVAAAWYSDKTETKECSQAFTCQCVDNECTQT
ncbi:MAG: hypothetical protein KKG59_04820 [Nanoarchaeota archaeon]|nr:hypothetical protein [Nanoarchaeota archaeon]